MELPRVDPVAVIEHPDDYTASARVEPRSLRIVTTLVLGVFVTVSLATTGTLVISRGQRGANDLVVVALHDVPVRERRVRPADHAVKGASRSIPGGGRWLDQLRATVLHVAGRGELRDDQIAVVVVHEVAVAMLHDGGATPAGLRGHLGAHPEPFARPRIQPSQLAVAADAIDMVADDERRGDHGVQPVGLVRKAVAARPLPEHGRLRAIGAEPHHHRPMIELRHEQVISASGRCGDRHALSHFPGLVPVHGAGFRVE